MYRRKIRMFFKVPIVIALFLTLSFLYGENGVKISKKIQNISDLLYDVVIMGGDHLEYSEFALDHLFEKYKVKPSAVSRGDSKIKVVMKKREMDRERENIDFYSILTGGLAIRESLQLESIRPSQNRAGNITISSLKKPNIKSHPFKKMYQGREVKMFPLASSVPEDFYYIHFNKMANAFEFFEYLNEVGGSLYQRVAPKSVDFQVKKKLMTQLAIKENKKSRKFYDLVIDEMAVTGSDPFVRNGSDITVLYKISKKKIFYSKIKKYRKEYAEKYDGSFSKIAIDEGLNAELLTTEDRKIHSFLAEFDNGTIAISNSQAALKRVYKASKKRAPSLSQADDFKYMRSIYVADENSEDGFIYLSESFIRNITGPEIRIKEARRMSDAVKLSALERFSLLYYQIHGKRASSLKELEMEFSPEKLRVFSGFKLDPNTFSAVSPKHGRLGIMTPNIETKIEYVSSDEAERYSRFVMEYNDFWSEFFDPIGIRFKFKDGVKIETTILPLIENSIYNALTEVIGGAPVKLLSSEKHIPGEIFSLSLKFRKEMISEFYSDMSKEFSRGKFKKNFNLAKILGDEIKISIIDAQPFVDFDAGQLTRALPGSRLGTTEIYAGVLISALFHPLKFTLPLKDKKLAKELIEDVEGKMFSLAGNVDRDFSVDSYSYIYKNIDVNVVKLSLAGIINYRMFYAVVGDNFVVTTTDDYMRRTIDGPPKDEEPGFWSSLFGGGKKEKKASENEKANIMAVYRPKEIKAEKNMFIMNMMESARSASLRNLGTYKLFSEIFPGKSDMDNDSLNNFGFKLECPSGGDYKIDEKSGKPYNTLYKSGLEPIDIKKIEKSDTVKRFFSTEEIKVQLRFTPEGIMTEIRIK